MSRLALTQIRAGAQNRNRDGGVHANRPRNTGGQTNRASFGSPVNTARSSGGGPNPFARLNPFRPNVRNAKQRFGGASLSFGAGSTGSGGVTSPEKFGPDLWASQQLAQMFSIGADGMVNAANDAYGREVFAHALRDNAYGGISAAVNKGLGIDLQGVGIDNDMTNVQLANIQPMLYDLLKRERIQKGQYGTALEQLKGAETEGRNIWQTQQNRFDRLTGENQRDEARDIRRLQGELAAQGAGTSFGARDMGQQLRDDAASERFGIGEDRQIAGTQFVKQMNDIRTGRDKLSWDLKDSRLSLDQQRRQINERKDLLHLEGKKHGLTAKRLQAAAEEQLAKLGLDKALSYGQLLQAQSDRDQKKAAAAQGLLQSIAQIAANPPIGQTDR